MISLQEHYKIDGHYLFNGVKGDQSGDLYLCSDHKIIGTIHDNNNDGRNLPLDPKALLGYFDGNKTLVFLKLPVGPSLLMPVIWYMKMEQEKPEMIFKGSWAFAPSLPVTESLDKIVNAEAINLDLMKEFPADELMQDYFSQFTLDQITKVSLANNSIGELRFSRI